MEFESIEELTKYVIAKISKLVEEHGEDAVADELDRQLDLPEHEAATGFEELSLSEDNVVLSETRVFLTENQIQNLLLRAAARGQIPKKSIPKLTRMLSKGSGGGGLVAAGFGKIVDQDVNIADQDIDLRVTDEPLYDLIGQTNDLIQTTNSLLTDLGDAVQRSNELLGDVDYDLDGILGNISNRSIKDVRQDQAAEIEPRSELAVGPGEEEEEEIPKPLHRLGVK